MRYLTVKKAKKSNAEKKLSYCPKNVGLWKRVVVAWKNRPRRKDLEPENSEERVSEAKRSVSKYRRKTSKKVLTAKGRKVRRHERMRKLEEELDSCMSTCVSPEQSLVATRLSSPSKLFAKVSGSLATIHISMLNCVENGSQLTGASCNCMCWVMCNFIILIQAHRLREGAVLF